MIKYLFGAVWLLIAVAGGAQGQSLPIETSPIQVSVLPNARAGAVGSDFTFYATVVNSSDREAQSCRHTGWNAPGGVPPYVSAFVNVFPLDDSGNLGPPANAWFSIPAGGRRDLLVDFSVLTPMEGALHLTIRCQFGTNDNSNAPVYPGVNDFHLTVTDEPGPDIIMIGDTVSRDGVMRVGQQPRTGLFVAAAINIGADASDLSVSPSYLGFSSLANLRSEICETNASGVCISARSDQVIVDEWRNGEVRTFAAFFYQSPVLGLPFFPDILRAQIEVSAAPAVSSSESVSTPAAISLDAPLARTSTAVLVAVGEAAGNPELFWGGYQCITQAHLSRGYVETHRGGVLLFSPDAGSQRPGGYLMAADRYDNVYRQPIELPGFDQSVLSGTRGADVRLLGMGSGQGQVTDGSLGGSVTTRSFQSISFDLYGSASMRNNFISPSRIRCVPIPARNPDDLPMGSRATAGLVGHFYAENIHEWGAPDRRLVEVIATQGERATLYEGGSPLISASNSLGGDEFRLGGAHAARAFGTFFETTLAVATTNPAPRMTGIRRSVDGDAVDCAVLVLPDNSAGTANWSSDARVLVLYRDGVDLDERDCIY